MDWRKLLVYGVIALGALLALRVALSVTLGFLGLLWSVITTAVALLAIGGLLYGGYRLLSWARSDQSPRAGDATQAPASTEDRIERLKDRYASGDLSEDEFERRLDQELGGPSMDSIDRELTRERE
jgi:uncharacterized membrane protein